MYHHKVQTNNKYVVIDGLESSHVRIYVDYQQVRQWERNNGVILLPITTEHEVVTIVHFETNYIYREDYLIRKSKTLRDREFMPGDILVASDNVKEELSGYMGHSAIVVDGQYLVEASGGHPAISKDTIQQFLTKHPIHAQFRPKEVAIGKKTADFANSYHKKYMDNLKNDIKKPVFSFQLSQDLDNIWEYIYCSKLVWACYHYGADVTFENDHLWFSPEDLHEQLVNHELFETVYTHPNVKFLINT
jgi:hypothetical protein